MIRLVCCEQKTQLRRPGKPSKEDKKCLLLHLLILYVLSVVSDTFLPQTSWKRTLFIYFYFLISSNPSICILNASRKWLPLLLLSPQLADKQGISVNVTPTKYTPLCRQLCAACATRHYSSNGCH